jgi:hypothetical protein
MDTAYLKSNRMSTRSNGSAGGRSPRDKFLDQELRKTRRVMPYDAMFLEQIVEQAAHS